MLKINTKPLPESVTNQGLIKQCGRIFSTINLITLPEISSLAFAALFDSISHAFLSLPPLFPFQLRDAILILACSATTPNSSTDRLLQNLAQP
jgi:hypothetical protein